MIVGGKWVSSAQVPLLLGFLFYGVGAPISLSSGIPKVSPISDNTINRYTAGIICVLGGVLVSSTTYRIVVYVTSANRSQASSVI